MPIPRNIQQTMDALVDGLFTILGKRLLGVYLGGSLTMGDFWEATSDLDFLVVTADELSPEDALAIDQLHHELLLRFADAGRLEGDYVPRALITAEGTAAPVPGCERGVFVPRVGEIMLSADNMYNMREQGMACYGPEPKAMFPPVATDSVRSSVRQFLSEGEGAAETAQEAAGEFLNLLRSACALESGVPTTKSAGAQWALSRLDERWHPIVRAALAIRRGESAPEEGDAVRTALPELRRMLRSRYC